MTAVYVLVRVPVGMGSRRTRLRPRYLTYINVLDDKPVERALRIARHVREVFGCPVWIQDSERPALLERVWS